MQLSGKLKKKKVFTVVSIKKACVKLRENGFGLSSILDFLVVSVVLCQNVLLKTIACAALLTQYAPFLSDSESSHFQWKFNRNIHV